MLFQTKPSLVVWLKRNSIVFADKQSQVELDIPDNIVHNLEVIDLAGLDSSIMQFCEAQNIKRQNAIIVLDDSIVFQKNIKLETNEDSNAKTEEFTSKVPLAPEQRQILTIHIKDQVILLAANKQYCMGVESGVVKAENKVIAAVPLVGYGVRDQKNLDPNVIDNILGNTAIIKEANFLHDK